MSEKPEDRQEHMKLNFLAKIEDVIEGIGEFTVMLVRSMFVAPTYLLRTEPFTRIFQAVKDRKLLPPLLYLILVILPTSAFIVFLKHAKDVLNDGDTISQVKAVWSVDVILLPAPAILTIWLTVELVSTLLARLTDHARLAIRATLFYMLAMVCMFLGPYSLFAYIYSSNRSDPLLNFAFGLLIIIIIIHLVIQIILGRNLFKKTRQRFASSNRFHKAAVSVVSFLMPFVVNLSIILAICVQIVFSMIPDTIIGMAMETPENGGGEPRIVVKASHCDVSPVDIACSLIIRPDSGEDIFAAEILNPTLKSFNLGNDASERIVITDLRSIQTDPLIGQGRLYRIKGSEPSLLAVHIPHKSFCALFKENPAVFPFSFNFNIFGYQAGSKGRNNKFEKIEVTSASFSDEIILQAQKLCLQ